MGRPKALLKYQGETFLERIVRTIADAPIDEVVVVLGGHRDEILDRISLSDWVYNPDYEQGMTTSLRVGIRAVQCPLTAAMLFLVDHPLVSVNTVRLLAARASKASIVIPVVGGRRGHPVLFGQETLDEILELPDDRGANAVVRAHPERVIEVPVDDAGILVDVDTPEEFGELSRPSRLS